MAAVVDVAVVGAGTVGCAVARELALSGYSVIVLEKDELASGASSGNSGIAHTAFDATVGTLEHTLMRRAVAQNTATFASLGLPFEDVGCLVVAWSQEELATLPSLLEKAHKAGVHEAKLLSRQELQAREPHLAPAALGALHVPGETLIDPWLTPIAYAAQAAEHGAKFLRHTELVGAEFADTAATWSLRLSDGRTFHAHAVINCGGLHGDRVEQLNGSAAPSFAVRPRKGQFAVFDRAARGLLRAIICPVPTERTKGVFLFPTLYGNILVGPTAEDQDDRTVPAQTDAATCAALVSRAHAMLPALVRVPVVAQYAGLRPATQHRDYVLQTTPARRWVTVGGIRSTGVTAALGIAQHVAREVQQQLDVLPTRLPVSGSASAAAPFSIATLAAGTAGPTAQESPRAAGSDAAANAHGLPVHGDRVYAGPHLGWTRITHPIAQLGWLGRMSSTMPEAKL